MFAPPLNTRKLDTHKYDRMLCCQANMVRAQQLLLVFARLQMMARHSRMAGQVFLNPTTYEKLCKPLQKDRWEIETCQHPIFGSVSEKHSATRLLQTLTP
jgi:murein endopeptidase